MLTYNSAVMFKTLFSFLSLSNDFETLMHVVINDVANNLFSLNKYFEGFFKVKQPTFLF